MISLNRFSRSETQVRAISETLWQRDPLAWLAIVAGAKASGMTLLQRIRERRAELQAMRRAA